MVIIKFFIILSLYIKIFLISLNYFYYFYIFLECEIFQCFFNYNYNDYYLKKYFHILLKFALSHYNILILFTSLRIISKTEHYDKN